MKIQRNYLLKKALIIVTLTFLTVNIAQAQTKTPELSLKQVNQNTPGKTPQTSRLKMLQDQLALRYKSKMSETTKTARVKEAFPTTYYTFTGTGSWFTPANWENGAVPPVVLKGGDNIIINGKGYCLLNDKMPFFLPEGTSIQVKPGNTFYVSIGNNLVFNGGVLTNNGTIKILSGVLNTKNTQSSGDIQTTKCSRIAIKKSIAANLPVIN